MGATIGSFKVAETVLMLPARPTLLRHEVVAFTATRPMMLLDIRSKMVAAVAGDEVSLMASSTESSLQS